MKKFIEVTGFGNGEKHLISVDNIINIHFDPRYTSIILVGGFKVNVQETEEVIREILEDGLQSQIVGFGDFNPSQTFQPLSEEAFLKSLDEWMENEDDFMLSPEELEDMAEIKSALREELGGSEVLSLEDMRNITFVNEDDNRDLDDEWLEYERGELPF